MAAEFSKTFTDALGRQWTVELDLRNDDRLEAVTGVSLVNLVPSMSDRKKADDAGQLTALSQFLSDPYAVFEAVWALVEPEATKRGIKKSGYPDSFKASLDPQAASAMGLSLLKAIHDFFPRDPARQAVIRRVAKAGLDLMAQMADRIETELNKVDLAKVIEAMPGIDAGAATTAAIERTRTSASGTAATSAATPAPPA